MDAHSLKLLYTFKNALSVIAKSLQLHAWETERPASFELLTRPTLTQSFAVMSLKLGCVCGFGFGVNDLGFEVKGLGIGEALKLGW